MADIAGPGGTITSISGFTCHFSGWAASLIPTVVDNTGFAEQGNRTSLPTAQIIVGSAKGTGQAVTIPSALTGGTPTMSTYQGTMTLQSASGVTASFYATITTMSLGREHDGKLEYGINFQSSGPITGTL
jgi:hypothetical protein